MIKRITAGFVAATFVGVVFCGANPASAEVWESFENWDGSANPSPGWENNAFPANYAVAAADGNGPTHQSSFLAFNDDTDGKAARYVAANDGGNDISQGWRFDYYIGASQGSGGTGTGIYFQVSDVNHGNIAEIILGSTEVVIEGSSGKESVISYANGQNTTQWRSIEVVPDYTNNQFSVIVDGVQSAAGNARAALGGVTGFNMNFYAANNAGVDNFRDVPEPASAALLCLGTVLMLRRRR